MPLSTQAEHGLEDASPGDPLDPLATREAEAKPRSRRRWSMEVEDLGHLEQQFTDDLAYLSLDVPSSSYGAAMVMVVQAHDAADRHVYMMAVAVFCFSVLSIVAEIFILISVQEWLTKPAVMHVRELYGAYHERAYADAAATIFMPYKFEGWPCQRDICQLPLANKTFCYAILAIWTGYILVDIKETIWYSYLWGNLPGVTGGSRSMAEWDSENKRYVVQRAPMGTKLLVNFGILLPKLFIALFAWWLGCRWLVSTPDYSSLVLNAIALAFVIQLDEMFFLCMLSRDTQRWVAVHCILRPDAKEVQDHMDRVGSHAFREQRIWNSLLIMMSASLTLLVAPAAYMMCQQAIPDYQWDVAEHCAAFWGEERHHSSNVCTRYPLGHEGCNCTEVISEYLDRRDSLTTARRVSSMSDFGADAGPGSGGIS